jgi:cytochrome c oxidase subunit 2
MVSQDVIHSFYVPAFRLKHDVLPGRYETMWLRPDRVGAFPLYCAEFCGTDHAAMTGRIVVMSPADFAEWLARGSPDDSLVAQGRAAFQRFGCSGCHDHGAAIRAPSLAGIYGTPVPLSDGRVVTADERYLRDSILLPHAEVVAGYEPRMPSFAGRIGEGDLMAIIAYLRSLPPVTP